MPLDTRKLTDLLAERFGTSLRLALLFGSHADGRAREDSDIDLALLCDEPVCSADRLALIGDIGAAFGLPVDLVDLHRAPYPVTGEALRGRRLIGDDETYAALAVRDTPRKGGDGLRHPRFLMHSPFGGARLGIRSHRSRDAGRSGPLPTPAGLQS